ncbi:MAG: hypothetical protein IPN10_14930 [Saprospiraceae bacterium]|nr:hypothetical protein [Saprospiraceae bacterium]
MASTRECFGSTFGQNPVGQPFAGHPSPIDIGTKFGTGVPTFEGFDLYPIPMNIVNLFERLRMCITFT